MIQDSTVLKSDIKINDTIYLFGAIYQNYLYTSLESFKFDENCDSLDMFEINNLPEDRIVTDAILTDGEYVFLAGPGIITLCKLC
ncbi:MAG: hypothetical protein R2771_11760 [Saprospiraceae bacterium]